MNKILLILAFSIIAIVVSSCQSEQITGDEIPVFLADYEQKAEFLNSRLQTSNWDFIIGGYSDSLDYYNKRYAAFMADKGLFEKVSAYRKIVSGGINGRKLDLIYREYLRTIIDYDPAIRRQADSLSKAAARHNYVFEGKTVSRRYLEEILKTEKDRIRREDAFRSLASLGETLSDGVAILARLRNQAAVRLGYNSYFDMMLLSEGIDRSFYSDLLEDIGRLSEEPYRRAFDSLTRVLNVNQLYAWDLPRIGHFPKLTASGNFAKDVQFGIVRSTLAGMGFDINARPIYISPVYDSMSRGSSTIIPAHIPDDVRIATRLAPGIGSLINLFDRVGRAVYLTHMDENDFLLAQPPAGCFEAAMAQIIAGLTELDDWRSKYGAIPEPEAIEMKRQNRLRKLIQYRQLLVRLVFERELYRDPFTDLSKLYNEIFERFMMFPQTLTANVWAIDERLISSPVTLQNEMIGLCIAAQTYNYLFEKYGSVLDNQRTREFLVQNYYRFGRNEEWSDLIERGMGDKLDARHLFSKQDN